MISRRNLRSVWAALAVTLGTACAVLPIAAQTSDVRVRPWPDSISDAIVLHTSTGSENTAGERGETVPVELLRHPLGEKSSRIIRKALEAIRAGHHEAAIGQLQEVLAKDPNSTYYAHSLLGFAYLKTDRYALAVESFETALKIVPSDAVNHYNLGLSLLSAGSYDRGEEEVRRALQLNPNNDKANALLRSLEQIRQTGP